MLRGFAAYDTQADLTGIAAADVGAWMYCSNRTVVALTSADLGSLRYSLRYDPRSARAHGSRTADLQPARRTVSSCVRPKTISHVSGSMATTMTTSERNGKRRRMTGRGSGIEGTASRKRLDLMKTVIPLRRLPALLELGLAGLLKRRLLLLRGINDERLGLDGIGEWRDDRLSGDGQVCWRRAYNSSLLARLDVDTLGLLQVLTLRGCNTREASQTRC